MEKHNWKTVAIVGVGLIGGSVGAALRQGRIAQNVVGIGRNQGRLQAARQAGCIDHGTTSLRQGVADAELVVVCTPVERIVDDVLEAADHCPKNACLTDAGSTKAEIAAALDRQLPEGPHFVGSHPLAGSEKAGARFAQHDLFEQRTVILTPTEKTEKGALETVECFWKSVGAKTIRMSPRDHDQALAAVSHLPHLVASALAASTPDKHLPLAASGWADSTRVAAGDAALWEQIFQQNKAQLLAALGRFEDTLSKLRKAMESDDRVEVSKLLQTGKDRRDSVGS